MDVVVVESPAKAKTINKYLGSGYTVLASFGHVRDLPRKDGSVRPDEDFAMDWEVDDRAKKHLADIAKALKGADHLYLATDPDREGEAISWHVYQALQQQHASSSTRSPRTRSPRRSATRATCTANWSTPISRAGRWTIWSASRSRPCSGARCRAASRPGACSRSRCG